MSPPLGLVPGFPCHANLLAGGSQAGSQAGDLSSELDQPFDGFPAHLGVGRPARLAGGSGGSSLGRLPLLPTRLPGNLLALPRLHRPDVEEPVLPIARLETPAGEQGADRPGRREGLRESHGLADLGR